MSGLQTTIRAQAKKPKVDQKQGQPSNARPPADGRERMDKEIVKAVLASPLIVPWPNIPKHLQNGVMAALPKLVTQDIADYHINRARCHQKDKKGRRKAAKGRPGEGKEGGENLEEGKDEADGVKDSQPMDVDLASQQVGASTLQAVRPTPPAVLEHLVLGINETIKTLERNIEDLKTRLMLIADRLNGTHLPTNRQNLLPTAPRSPSPSPSPSPPESSPMAWVVVPLLSISPQSLVSPIPQYCATYNSLVYQWGQLQKAVKTRLKETEWEVLGEEREEIRVVPLGDVEKHMAELVGLRRLACLGIKTSHPNIKVIRDLLPKSVLHPPRYSITLPFPTSAGPALGHDRANTESTDERPNKKLKPTSSLPIPHVHYAPLVVKGITTTTPADGNARKNKRLLEVRQKRVETKEKKREERRKEFLKGMKGKKGKVPRHGIKPNGKGKSKGGKSSMSEAKAE